ncbi:MAG TPA: family 20 glycosylhydrolase [Phycisphaerales bacterium]|nr:family 20 glycosylhydrolase [Phycisphaerales bacterium]
MSVAVPILLPSPRFIRLTGGAARRPAWLARAADEAWAHLCGHDPHGGEGVRLSVDLEHDLPGQGYRLRIERGDDGLAELSIGIGSRKGERHALATLRQLLSQCPADLPCLEIEDSPAFATRGVMLDVSRDKVPTMAHLEAIIDLLASLKFNHLQLYTEHTFAYTGHEEVWTDASPITPAEARELDACCAARGIELAANQNCFGHLASWLKRPAYAHLAEIEGNNPWCFHQWERRGPFSLCPVEPRAEAFVNDLLGQLLPCFQSGLVNIGCDETFDVGWGRSKEEVERRVERGGGAGEQGSKGADAVKARARAELYFEFVAKVARVCERHGKRPMMWGDIALTHPDMLDRLPRDMVGLAWWYEPTDRFARWVETIRGAGHEAWVCPGTSSWRTFTGRTTERRANIADAAEQGAKAGATGFLVCDWGDMGHRQQWPISLAGLAHAAEAAWNPDRARDFDAHATGIHALCDPSGRLGPWLDDLGNCDLDIRTHARVLNASALFNDLHPPVPGQLKAGDHEVGAPTEMWLAAGARLDALATSRPAIADPLVQSELDHAMACARFAADHAVAMRDEAFLAAHRSDLLARVEAIRTEHERLWLVRNRPGGLATATRHYDRVIAALRASL